MQRMAVMAEQWHEQAPADMALLFETDLSLGLSEKEAEQRLKEVGLNLLSQTEKNVSFPHFFAAICERGYLGTFRCCHRFFFIR
ncbi:TPA: hypothetical protein JBF65_14145 [Legionella pneumophila]|nr:hypothetical protein A6J41_011925 [Legionella pneumophila subsp. pneumophila]PPK34362.1 hypothetical protein C3927_04465 [Legionella pneumophila]QDD14234.1 hypothetical protein FIU05_00275 [Legionella pneumophila]QGK66153.1 hypothetical protein GJD98_05200 [Legionella pneumophila]RDE56533.1 hypothetical protein DV939_05210 [Legionella pneumophila]